MMALTKDEKEWFPGIMKEAYENSKAKGLQGIELKAEVKSYALGLIGHIIDSGDTPKRTIDCIKLVLEYEKIIVGWIDASK